MDGYDYFWVGGRRAAPRGGAVLDVISPSTRWVGVDNVLLETDFPHGDSSWPRTRAVLDAALQGFSPEESYALRIGNALHWHRLAESDVAIPSALVQA